MHINELNFYQDTFEPFEEHREDDSTYESAFPLFNMAALRESQIQMSNFDYMNAEKISDMVEEITAKKQRGNNGQEVVVKRRGRKAVPKDAKLWDDPTITMKEIIENDLAGEATAFEIKAKEERLRKMREGKALKRAQRLQAQNGEVAANQQAEETNKAVEANAIVAVEQSAGPQILFIDGKVVVVDDSNKQKEKKKLVLVENNKPHKLTSMSFRTKNHTSKWTEAETRKFYKAIEIFGADFSMIAKLFQTRNRDQVKNKFNKESKVNEKLIDEAFKKNAVLSKRSIMERIRMFNENVTAVRNDTTGNMTFEAVTLERFGSNTSTDSLDLKVLEEIQDIFVKEINVEKAKNNAAHGPFNFFNGTTFAVEEKGFQTENKQQTSAVEVVNMNVYNNEVEENKTQAVAVKQQKNLLLRLFD